MPVMANSGCVIMEATGNDVFYYQKCNHCQHSEYEKPLKEAPAEALKECIEEIFKI